MYNSLRVSDVKICNGYGGEQLLLMSKDETNYIFWNTDFLFKLMIIDICELIALNRFSKHKYAFTT